MLQILNAEDYWDPDYGMAMKPASTAQSASN
jgi:hypothetical protein